MRKAGRVYVWMLVTAVTICLESVANADMAVSAGDTGETLETIIVTAQKREQAIGDVGITIVAVSGKQILDLGVTNVNELTKMVPGFTVAPAEGGYPIYSIRGVGYNANQLGALPTVSTYIDEASITYPAMTAGTILDLERVEVLKGPQGTLFGQNSTAGSINFIAAKPTEKFSAGFQSSIQNFGKIYEEAFVSGPLTDTLRARFAASTTQGGAWQESWTRNDTHGRADLTAARLLVDFAPTNSVKISLNLNGFIDNSDTQINQLAQLAIANPANPAPGLVNYPLPPRNDRAADWDPNVGTSSPYGTVGPFVNDNTFYQAVLRADLNVSENVTLTSITDYSDLNYKALHDIDGTNIDIVTARAVGEAKSFVEELRLTGKMPDARINYIAGVNYQNDKVPEETQYSHIHYSGLPQMYLNPFADSSYKTTGVFGNVDWELSDHLTATVGARYTSIKQGFVGCTRDAGDGAVSAFFGGVANSLRAGSNLPPTNAYVPGGCGTIGPSPTFLPFLGDLSSTDSNVSWRAGLNYKPNPDTLLYALTSRGFKAGGFFLGVAIFSNSVNKVAQEELTSYELGIKYTVDRRLNVTASLFDYQYDNKQLYTYESDPAVGTLAILANIPKASARGGDIDLNFVPVPGLTLRGGATYSRTRIGNYLGLNPGVGTENFEGNVFNYAPLWSGTLDAEYLFPFVGQSHTFVGAHLLYNSRAFSDLAESASLAIPAYAVFDARLGVETVGGWRTTVWANNLSNKYYWTNALVGADADYRTMGMPRTFGFTVSYRF